ncbi:MAG TPA: hypothetical protein VFE47_18925 [Tepidisphaeraceae bacterium]|jgi:hypothetical protein|nr:hypothetical protein [Tepidisphaeraceae bacterium]
MDNSKRPLAKDNAPDTATVYERAKPEKEAGMGRLDNNPDATPTQSPDAMEKVFGNKQNPENQLNAEDVVDGRAKKPLNHR